MSNAVHHIDAEGKRILCTAPPDARCHRRPLCDTATWHDQLCDEHNAGHEVLSGQDCWMAEWPNAWTLEDSSEQLDPINEGAAVVLTYHGLDICVTWRLANLPKQV